MSLITSATSCGLRCWPADDDDAEILQRRRVDRAARSGDGGRRAGRRRQRLDFLVDDGFNRAWRPVGVGADRDFVAYRLLDGIDVLRIKEDVERLRVILDP